jgi:hypothetical protein
VCNLILFPFFFEHYSATGVWKIDRFLHTSGLRDVYWRQHIHESVYVPIIDFDCGTFVAADFLAPIIHVSVHSLGMIALVCTQMTLQSDTDRTVFWRKLCQVGVFHARSLDFETLV